MRAMGASPRPAAAMAAATVVRLVVLLYGEWQDNNFAVKYTDVDYRVYSDAALLVTQVPRRAAGSE